jgi:hypothetical protein
MLHWAMRFVSHRRTAMAIKIPNRGGGLFPIIYFCHNINVAKVPSCSPKLTPSYSINLIGVISLFVYYWLSLMTLDAISATIIANRQA